MTPEQVERTIQFILEQQARLTTDLAQLTEHFVEERRAAAEERKANREMFETLVDGQYKLLGAVEQLTANVAQLADTHRATDERLNALIGVVDKLVTRGNGGGRGPA